ncbi:MAG: ribosome maturation factor RimM [Nocardioides sp.]
MTPHNRSLVDVLVGRIAKAHGLRGEVVIDVRTDEPESRFVPGVRFRCERTPGKGSATAPPGGLTLVAARWHGNVLLARFAEAADRTAAEPLRGLRLHLEIPADQTPADPDEFYDHQLIGLIAYDLGGAPIGELTSISHGAQDLLTIRTEDGRDALVPFVRALVPEVDIAAGRIVIADRPGLVAPFGEE